MLRSIQASVLAALILAPSLAAQSDGTACEGEEYRQFDFWVGEWQVFSPQGQKLGENTIALSLGDCVLHESWRGASGGIGNSYSIYDQVRGLWHQSWVDNSGNLLLLDGALTDGAMVLRGPGADGQGPLTNRVSWTPISADSVRQLWEVSRDGGETWQAVFDGFYLREDGGMEADSGS